DPGQFVGRQHADALQAFGVRLARLDVEQEELAVEDDVVAGEEGLDLRIHFDAGFLPEQLAHVVSRGSGGSRDCAFAASAAPTPAGSGRPKARLRFCSAWVAAPLSRLSSVATTTRRRPSGDRVKPPISSWWRPAMRLTHGASPST